jgi:hypothetical protein
MFISNFDSSTNTFEVAGYISTSDYISNNELLTIDYGIYDIAGVRDDFVGVPMRDNICEIYTFYKDDTVNYPHEYSDFDFYAGYTLTNVYSQNKNDADARIYFIQPIDYVRSVMTFQPAAIGDPDSEYRIRLENVPLSRGSWCVDPANYMYLVENIYAIYQQLQVVFFELENAFSMCLYFYNTYGKAKFFRVGLKYDYSILDNVTCRFKFGVRLTELASPDFFVTKFREFVKTGIESINTGREGQSVYIMNLIAELKQAFTEIDYLEYYGFNGYNYSAQKIESLSSLEIDSAGIVDYIPEFINIGTKTDAAGSYPDIDVEILGDPE